MVTTGIALATTPARTQRLAAVPQSIAASPDATAPSQGESPSAGVLATTDASAPLVPSALPPNSGEANPASAAVALVSGGPQPALAASCSIVPAFMAEQIASNPSTSGSSLALGKTFAIRGTGGAVVAGLLTRVSTTDAPQFASWWIDSKGSIYGYTGAALTDTAWPHTGPGTETERVKALRECAGASPTNVAGSPACPSGSCVNYQGTEPTVLRIENATIRVSIASISQRSTATEAGHLGYDAVVHVTNLGSQPIDDVTALGNVVLRQEEHGESLSDTPSTTIPFGDRAIAAGSTRDVQNGTANDRASASRIFVIFEAVDGQTAVLAYVS